MLNAKSREERINLELGLCELLLGSTVLSRDWFFFECAHAEREREREREKREEEREREWTELTAGVNFVFSGFLDDPRRDKRASKCRGWEELGAAKRTVAYRPVSSVLTGISLPSIFSQSAERPHEQRRMASKKEQLFALFFVAWITHFSHGKFFMGFRRAKSTQGNTNCQKNIFEDDQVPGHHPRALNCCCSLGACVHRSLTCMYVHDSPVSYPVTLMHDKSNIWNGYATLLLNVWWVLSI